MYNNAALGFCAGGFAFFVILFAFILLMRYLNYKETLSLAEKGLVRPQGEARNGKSNLKTGILLASVGLALILGMLPLGAVTSFPLGFGPWMILGLLPLFIGLGMVLIHVVTREPKDKDKK
jgi:hypothetical protein